MENGMIVGAWREDPQNRPGWRCARCGEESARLWETPEGRLCELCLDDYLGREEAGLEEAYTDATLLPYLRDPHRWCRENHLEFRAYVRGRLGVREAEGI